MLKTSIRSRLTLALLVPVGAVAVIAGFGVRDASSAKSQVEADTRMALAAGGPATLVTALMDERNIVGLELLGLENVVELRVASSTEAAAQTDERLAQLQADIGASDAQVQEIYGETVEAIAEDVASARRMSSAYNGPRDMENLFADEVYSTYSGIVDGFHEANRRATALINDAELRNRAQSIANQSLVSDNYSRLSRLVALSTLQGEATIDNTLEAQQIYSLTLMYEDEAVRLIQKDSEATEMVHGFYSRPSQAEFYSLIDDYLVSGSADPSAVIAAAGDTTFPNAADAWLASQGAISRRASERIGEVDGVRSRNITLFALAALATAGTAFFASRSLSRPLHRLADEAREMAETGLPGAVERILSTPLGQDIDAPEVPKAKGSKVDEINQLAEALNSVQTRTLELATTQAGMQHNIADSFMNMGRRVQTLVTRQLDFLTHLEGAEADPDRLRDLFKLDHIAARIRRNSESLMVLAGSGGQGITAYGEPESLLEVARYAMAEVEGYERVDLKLDPSVGIAHSVAGALAHVLAELFENGLNFSPPDARLEVKGEATTGTYVVTITDWGIGMRTEAIEEANRRLSGAESFTVSPSKYLGHYVAGSLAERIGVVVTIGSNRHGGISAVVAIPEPVAVFAEPEPAQREIPPFETLDHTADPAAPDSTAAEPAIEATATEATSPTGSDSQPQANAAADEPTEPPADKPVGAEATHSATSAPEPVPAAGSSDNGTHLKAIPQTEVGHVDGRPPALSDLLASAKEVRRPEQNEEPQERPEIPEIPLGIVEALMSNRRPAE